MSSAPEPVSEDARYARARALAGLRPPVLYAEAKLLFADSEWRIRRAAWEALLQADADHESRFAFLLACLESEDNAGTRGAALEALIALGARSVQFLTAALPTREPRFQRYILDVLMQIGAPEAAAAALPFVTSVDENIAFAAAEVVGHSGTSDDAKVLSEALASAIQTRRFALLAAIVQIAKREKISGSLVDIETYLDDPILRGPAIDLLGFTGDDSAVPLLWAQVAERKPLDKVILSLDRLRVRGFALQNTDARKIEIIAARCVSATVETAVRRAGFELVAEGAPGGLAKLMATFAEYDSAWLTARLAQFEDVRLRELLPAIVSNDKGRSIAANLYKIRPSIRGESALLALLNQPGDHQVEAVAALAAVGSLRCAPHLIALCSSADVELAMGASEALLGLAKRGIVGLEPILFKTISGVTPEVLARLLPAAGWLCESVRARELVCLAMRDSEALVRRAAVSSAVPMAIDPEVAHLLMRSLSDEDDIVRAAAAEACGKAGLIAAAEALAVLLEDASPWVEAAALEALVNIGLPPGKNRIVELLARGGITAVSAAALTARGPFDPDFFQQLVTFLELLDEDTASELLKSLAQWPNAVPREVIERLRVHEAWSVRAAVVQYLEVKKPEWFAELGRDWLKQESDDWVRTRLVELVGN